MPLAVVVVATGGYSPHEVLASVRRLAELLPPSVPLWAGGARAEDFAAQLAGAGAVYIESLEVFEHRIAAAMPRG